MATYNYDSLLEDLYKIKENLLSNDELLNRRIKISQNNIYSLSKDIEELNKSISEFKEKLYMIKHGANRLKQIFFKRYILTTMISIILSVFIIAEKFITGNTNVLMMTIALISWAGNTSLFMLDSIKILMVNFMNMIKRGADAKLLEEKLQSLMKVKELKESSLATSKIILNKSVQELKINSQELRIYEQYITEITYGKKLAEDLNVDNAVDCIFEYDSRAQDILKKVRK